VQGKKRAREEACGRRYAGHVATRRKIALLGARGFEQTTDEARVDSFSWDRIESISNLRDYDSALS
jgi:hypothetical protein